MPSYATIRGTAFDDTTLERFSGLHLVLGQVSGSQFHKLQSVYTDKNGQFFFDADISSNAAGRYEVRAIQDGRRRNISDGEYRFSGVEAPEHLNLKVTRYTPEFQADAAPAIPGGSAQSVRGLARHADGTPMVGKEVRAYYQRVDGLVRLTSDNVDLTAITDSEGGYSMRYDEAPKRLIVRVFDATTEIGVSQLIAAPVDHQRVDVVVTGDGARGTSEYEKMDQRLSSFNDGVAYTALSSDGISILADAASMDPRKVRQFVRAQQLAATAPVGAEVVYALVRLGYGDDIDLLSMVPKPRIEEVLQKAVDQNYVSSAVLADPSGTATSLRGEAVTRSLANTGRRPLGELLDTVTTDAAKQQAFAQILFDHRGPASGVWTKVAADPLIGSIAADLRRMFDLGEITGAHAKLVQAINEDSPGIPSKEAAAFTVAQWKQLLIYPLSTGGSPGVPDRIPGADAAEKETNYLAALGRVGEHRFPDSVVRNRLLGDGTTGTKMSTFLTNNPDHKFASKVTDAMATSDPELKEELRRYQRMYRMGSKQGRHAAIAAMRENGLNSSWEVARLGKSDFIKKVTTGANSVPAAVALDMFERAKAIVGANTAVLMNLLPNSTPINLVPDGQTPDEVSTDTDFTDIFGAIDFCACKHCRSLLGPAAYLVDLLDWLNQKNHLGTLMSRRPDIQHLLLTCENTNKALPHIDIVLEVLENAVAPSGVLAFDTGDSAAESLLGNPQNINPAAYDALLAASFPVSAPFQFFNAQADVFLAHLGIDRVELMEAFQTTTAPTALELSAAQIGLSQGGLDNLTAAGIDYEAWGFDVADSATWIALLTTDVGLLRKRLSLTRTEMLAVLSAEFWNPASAHSLTPPTECDPDNTDLSGSPTTTTFTRLMQFVRAWRTLGWTWLETDKALAALPLSGGTLTTADVEVLSTVQQLKSLGSVDVTSLLSLWAPIDTRVDDSDDATASLYTSLFLRDDVTAQVVGMTSPFALDAATPPEVATASLLSDHTAALQAAFGVGEAELDAAITDAATDGYLTVANLSAVYRRIVLAQVVDLTVQQVLALEALEPGAFDAFADPATTLAFAKRVAIITELPVPIEEVLYAARLDSPTASDVAPTEAWMQSVLGALRDSIQPLLDVPTTPDADGALLRARLGELILQVDVDAVFVHLDAGGTLPDGDELNVLNGYLDPAVRAQMYAAEPNTVATRYKSVLYGIERGLAKIAARAQVVQSFSDASGVNTDVLEVVRTQTLTYAGIDDFTDAVVTGSFIGGSVPGEWDDITSAAFPDAFAMLELTCKIASIVDAFGADADELTQWFAALAAGKLGLIDLRDLMTSTVRDMDQWVSTAAWFSFRDRMAGDAPTFPELWATLLEVQSQANLANQFLPMVEIRTGWVAADLNILALNFGLVPTAPSPEILDRIALCAELADKGGVTIATMSAWKELDLSFSDASAVISTARAHHTSESSWNTAVRPLRDELRDQQQRALVDYVVGVTANIDDINGLHAHFLLDVQTAPCSLTSRVKSALSSVQLFVQRGFLGLESSVTFDDDHREEWDLRKNYRLWEAARKVFLYPENWIEPELRDDKTPFFEELETALVQGELNDKSVKDAAIKYVESVKATSNLDVVCIRTDPTKFETYTVEIPPISFTGDPMLESVDDVDDSWMPFSELTIKIPTEIATHIFGRTLGKPHKYYYRKRLIDQTWTPWEPMNLDIQSDNIVASFVDGRLRIFWPTYQKVTAQSEAERDTYTVTMHMSEYEEGTWSPPKISDVPMQGAPHAEPYNNRFYLGEETPEVIEIKGSFMVGETLSGSESGFQGGGFIFNVATDELMPDAGFPYVITTQDQPGITPPTYTDSWYQQFRNDSGKPVLLPVGEVDESILDEAGVSWRLTANGSDWTEPFVFRGLERSFLVTPKFSSDALVDSYTFANLSHPFTSLLLSTLRVDGIDAVLHPDAGTDLDRQQLVGAQTFDALYLPTDAVLDPKPVDAFHFEDVEATSIYNWELFFHGPLAVANRLSQDQRFEDALRWYHVMFDPSNRDPSYVAELRPWKLKPFQEPVAADVTRWASFTGADPADPTAIAAKEEFERQVSAWLQDPFNPHLIARLRPGTYQRAVVMKYLDNLVAFGDSLFQRDSIESLNEALQVYIFAQDILGTRPEILPNPVDVVPQSYLQLQGTLDAMNNAVVSMVNVLLDTDLVATSMPASLDVAPVFYFCVPPNDALLKYWDTLEDRLYKIRNCLNIEGQFRVLSLFQPPIDPAALVRASANGVSLGTLLSELDTRLPNHRFNVMLGRAQQVLGTVKGLGSAMLQALEKKDSESLSVLRSTQEIALQEQVRLVRELQLDNAKESLASARLSLGEAKSRRDHYSGLVKRGLIGAEKEQAKRLKKAFRFDVAASAASGTAGVLALVPELKGPLPLSVTFGGSNLNAAARATAAVAGIGATVHRFEAQKAGVAASNKRRKTEWKFQRDQATAQMESLEQQIQIATLAIDIAKQELENHDLQIENSRGSDAFMRSKFTNEDLYSWMVTELSKIYFQTYQLAYDFARKAQSCYRHELGLPDASFIVSGHWDSLKKGLLAGERLQQQLEAMDASYLDKDTREYEITKHISLELSQPEALLALKSTGGASFELKRELFDLDFPSHYFRRIKSVSLTVPGVAGPFVGVNCKLTCTKSSTHRTPTAGSTADEDSMYADAIVTSGAADGTGLFRFDFSDPRYLPFERRGVESEWNIELTSARQQFDWKKLRDVVMTVRYTAREAGSVYGATVAADLQTAQTSSDANAIAFSVSAAFADAWADMWSDPENPVLTVPLAGEHFPFMHEQAGVTITGVEVYPVGADYSTPLATTGIAIDVDGAPVLTLTDASVTALDQSTVHGWGSGVLAAGAGSIVVNMTPDTFDGRLKAITTPETLSATAVQDLIIIVKYQVAVGA